MVDRVVVALFLIGLQVVSYVQAVIIGPVIDKNTHSYALRSLRHFQGHVDATMHVWLTAVTPPEELELCQKSQFCKPKR